MKIATVEGVLSLVISGAAVAIIAEAGRFNSKTIASLGLLVLLMNTVLAVVGVDTRTHKQNQEDGADANTI